MISFYICTISLLICTLTSENQGLEKSRSYSNLRKFSGPANLDFFLVYSKKLAFFLGGDLEKSPGLQDLKFFYGLKQTLIFEDLDFQKSKLLIIGLIFFSLLSSGPKPSQISDIFHRNLPLLDFSITTLDTCSCKVSGELKISFWVLGKNHLCFKLDENLCTVG